MPDEAAFLDAIRRKPDDDTTRLVYADWLDEQGDTTSATESEYLRVECRLSEISPDSAEAAALQARRSELAKKVTRRWLAIVSKVAIENCPVEFEFECPRKWEALR